ncbi:hypothetical protein Hanom_Chr10g00966731 [Helianthus anomalus]
MDPYNPNNPNSISHPFSSSGYTPVMDNTFAGYQQMPRSAGVRGMENNDHRP